MIFYRTLVIFRHKYEIKGRKSHETLSGNTSRTAFHTIIQTLDYLSSYSFLSFPYHSCMTKKAFFLPPWSEMRPLRLKSSWMPTI